MKKALFAFALLTGLSASAQYDGLGNYHIYNNWFADGSYMTSTNPSIVPGGVIYDWAANLYYRNDSTVSLPYTQVHAWVPQIELPMIMTLNLNNRDSMFLADLATKVTQAGARGAISLTTTGSSGAATYNSTTGVLNIPSYSGGGSGTVTSIVAGTGLSGGTITTTGTISLPNTGTTGTYSDVTTDAQGQ